jgi:hypothetical protein
MTWRLKNLSIYNQALAQPFASAKINFRYHAQSGQDAAIRAFEQSPGLTVLDGLNEWNDAP